MNRHNQKGAGYQLKVKNNCFEIKHNGHSLLFLVVSLFSFVIILEIIDFAVHSFTANWFMYIGLIVFCVLLSLPVLFTTLKIQIENDKIIVVKTCGIRFELTIDKIDKIVIVKPDTVERQTNIITRIRVYEGKRKFYVDSKMNNYDKFFDHLMKNVNREIIEYKVNWFTKSRD